MKWRSDTFQLNPGKWTSSKYPGHGVLGSVLRAETSTGDHGAAPLYNDLDSAADDVKEYRLRIKRWPTKGVLSIDERSVFTYTGDPDYAIGELFENGVSKGDEVISLFGGTPPDPGPGPDPVNPTIPPRFSSAIVLGVSVTGQLVILG